MVPPRFFPLRPNFVATTSPFIWIEKYQFDKHLMYLVIEMSVVSRKSIWGAGIGQYYIASNICGKYMYGIVSYIWG